MPIRDERRMDYRDSARSPAKMVDAACDTQSHAASIVCSISDRCRLLVNADGYYEHISGKSIAMMFYFFPYSFYSTFHVWMLSSVVWSPSAAPPRVTVHAVLPLCICFFLFWLVNSLVSLTNEWYDWCGWARELAWGWAKMTAFWVLVVWSGFCGEN